MGSGGLTDLVLEVMAMYFRCTHLTQYCHDDTSFRDVPARVLYSAVQLAKNLDSYARTHHVDIRGDHTRELAETNVANRYQASWTSQTHVPGHFTCRRSIHPLQDRPHCL